MGVEILQPFQLDTNGQIASTDDPDIQVDQHLLSLVSTNPGERVMLPNYGVPTFKYMFSMNSAENQQGFLNSVNSAMASWEPNITVDVEFINTENLFDGEMDIQINWSTGNEFTSSSNGLLTATVLVGGTVVEDTNVAS
jgi:uncharacterized protein